jgi:hypothetical protein
MELTQNMIGQTLKVNGVEVQLVAVENAYKGTVRANGREWQINTGMKIETASTRYALRGTV